MVTANALQRTLHLRFQGGTGTGFLIDNDGRQYLVTATHVIGAQASGQFELEIMHDNSWKPVVVTTVGHAAHGADISVFSLPHQIAPSGLSLPVAKHFYLAQDAYFLGFPFGEYGEIGPTNNDYPMPFVKRAIISSFNKGGRPSIVYLDGHNNPGFSGGPVIIKNPGNGEFEVLAVVSAYRYEPQNVQYNGIPSPELAVNINTGIVHTYNVSHALEVIEKNPIGAVISCS